MYTEHWVRTKDRKKLQVWLFKNTTAVQEASPRAPSTQKETDCNQSALPLLLYFHGNAGNLGDRLPHIKR